jgi:hypothetical protein
MHELLYVWFSLLFCLNSYFNIFLKKPVKYMSLCQGSHYFQIGGRSDFSFRGLTGRSGGQQREVTSLSGGSQGEVTSLSGGSQGEVTSLSGGSQGEVGDNRERSEETSGRS